MGRRQRNGNALLKLSSSNPFSNSCPSFGSTHSFSTSPSSFSFSSPFLTSTSTANFPVGPIAFLSSICLSSAKIGATSAAEGRGRAAMEARERRRVMRRW